MGTRKIHGMTRLEHLTAWLSADAYAYRLRKSGESESHVAEWEERAKRHLLDAHAIKPLPHLAGDSAERAS